MFKLVQNDRMFRKQIVIASNLKHEEATRLQRMKYLNSDPWMQYAVELEREKK